MTEEAAPPPRPEAASPGGPPPPPPTGPAGPPPTAGSAPFGAPPPGYAPPPGGAGFTSRYGLVRPRDGRYLAGVCAAIGRATNTDPVLWRVLLAVLGFFGGIGILVYLTAWLIIPGEGDTASPVESMLGRGRSTMSPTTVIVLSIVVAIGFGYIVTDALRAVLLGAVILIGGALLLNRQPRNAADRQPAGAGPAPGPVPPPAAWPTTATGAPGGGPMWGAAGSAGWGGARAGTAARPVWPATGAGSAWSAAGPSAPPAQPAAEYGTEPGTQPTAGYPGAEQAARLSAESTATIVAGQQPTWPGTPTTGPFGPPISGPSPSPVGAPLPPGGYRPPFAPHGPYAGPYPPAPPAPARPVRAPKRPKERSALGAVTFSLIFLALGVVAVLDLLRVFPIGAAGYFAAALATIGFGLLVGTWFGRARWLIALGLVTASALGIATVAESYDRVGGINGNVTWAPPDYQSLAARYKKNFGDAVLDLRAVDFDQKDTQVTVEVNFGKLTVIVPPEVDVTTVANVNAADASVLGRHSSGLNGGTPWETTDLGPDGRGGGTLRLLIHVNAGELEVTR